jgi:hypothetical protein
MKNLLNFIKIYGHFVWLIGAFMYYLLGATDMVTTMLCLYILEDSFEKVSQKINKNEKGNQLQKD